MFVTFTNDCQRCIVYKYPFSHLNSHWVFTEKTLFVTKWKEKCYFNLPTAKCTATAFFPGASDHIWRLWTCLMAGSFFNSILNFQLFSGLPSSKNQMESFPTLTVVHITMSENIKVQMGSAILALGSNLMIKAAIRTPTLCRKSPSTWIAAALTFMLLSAEWLWLPRPWLCVWQTPWRIPPILITKRNTRLVNCGYIYAFGIVFNLTHTIIKNIALFSAVIHMCMVFTILHKTQKLKKIHKCPKFQKFLINFKDCLRISFF